MGNNTLTKRLGSFDKRTYYYPKFKHILKYVSNDKTVIESDYEDHIIKPKITISNDRKSLTYRNVLGIKQTLALKSILDLIPRISTATDSDRRILAKGVLKAILKIGKNKYVFSVKSNPESNDYYSSKLEINQELLRIRDLILEMKTYTK